MGFWAGIKYALNSTLGTDDFKPLDQIIIGQKRFSASDATIKVITQNEIRLSKESTQILGYFTPKLDGTIRLNATMDKSSDIYGTSITIGLYGSSGGGFLSHNSTTNVSKSIDLEVSKGIRYEIRIRTSSDPGTFSNISLSAVVTDTNETFDFEEA